MTPPPHRCLAIPLLIVACATLTGCPPGPVSQGLPFGAVLTQESGSTLSFTAAANGTVYLRDQPADRIIFESRMDQGQRLEVDGEANQIKLDGRVMKVADQLRPDATYQVYFKAGRE